MRKIDLYYFRRDEVEKNALIVLPPQTSFVHFFEQLYKRPRDKLILPKVKIL